MTAQLSSPHEWPALSDWFEDFPFGARRRPDEHPIRIEEYQEDGTYTVRAELPRFREEDVEVTVAGAMLTIHAERGEEKKEGKRSEFCYGSFTRSVWLPADIVEDAIKAGYDNGVLTVTAPLSETERETRQIPIRTGE